MATTLIVMVLVMAMVMAMVMANLDLEHSELPSLGVLGEHHEPFMILMGSAIAYNCLIGDDTPYREIFSQQYAILTAENAMKWAPTQPQLHHYTFHAADTIVEWAQSHSIHVRGHNLVWSKVSVLLPSLSKLSTCSQTISIISLH